MVVTLAYATMQGVAQRKTTIPILSNLLVEAREGHVTIISRMWAGKSDALIKMSPRRIRYTSGVSRPPIPLGTFSWDVSDTLDVDLTSAGKLFVLLSGIQFFAKGLGHPVGHPECGFSWLRVGPKIPAFRRTHRKHDPWPPLVFGQSENVLC
jgi:hypothetical protein